MTNATVLLSLLIASIAFTSAQAQVATPEADRDAMRSYYSKRFPQTPLEEHKDGVYAIDENARDQWLEMEDFPPYEIAVDIGVELFAQPLGNGFYADCFADEGAVAQLYPFFDEDRGIVVTLAMAINECRVDHEVTPLEYDGPEINALTAYMAYASRGHTVAVATPESDAALAAYQTGKQFYSTRRGILNVACASCHVQLAGNRLRAEKLSATLGHVTHWPVYRFKWEEVGSLHRRFAECNSQVGAEPFPAQSAEYRNLEYFLSYLSNGFELNGPATRK